MNGQDYKNLRNSSVNYAKAESLRRKHWSPVVGWDSVEAEVEYIKAFNAWSDELVIAGSITEPVSWSIQTYVGGFNVEKHGADERICIPGTQDRHRQLALRVMDLLNGSEL